MGYSAGQLQDLAATIAVVDCETIAIATPADLSHLLRLPYPACRVQYDLEEVSRPDLAEVLEGFLHTKVGHRQAG
jgi:predicted GTPase